MLLYYVRHGRPTYNPDELKPVGHRQAEAVARRLALYGVDRVYASSSNRAIETARPTAEICEREITILDWCNEGHAWKYTAVQKPDGTWSWAFTNPDFRRKFLSPEVTAMGGKWYDHPDFAALPFKNGIETVNAQVDGFFADLGYRHDRGNHIFTQERQNDERIALFAHEGFGKMFLSSLLDIPYPIFCTRFSISYTGLTVVEFKAENDGSNVVIPRVLSFGNDAHLYRDGLPTHFQNRLYF